ncbi:MAG: zinc-ribbon domain-containing protein [Treponema sp.]|jgi:tellurium resistance protein TerD|nr:zinc-ribbon domain-containing protein [Treponema sp.]
MAFCVECGTQLEDSVKFCPECGTQRTGSGESPAALAKTAPRRRARPKKVEEDYEEETMLDVTESYVIGPSQKVPRNMRNAGVGLCCAKCGSAEITTQEKGFGLGKAALGGLLLGPVGLAAGMLGRKKVKLICLKCGHKWQAGKR